MAPASNRGRPLLHRAALYASHREGPPDAVEPRQQWIDQGHTGARSIEDLVNDLLVANDPFPTGTAVFAAAWKPGQWGLGQVTRRTDLDEWVVLFIDGSGEVLREHMELCPAL